MSDTGYFRNPGKRNSGLKLKGGFQHKNPETQDHLL